MLYLPDTDVILLVKLGVNEAFLHPQFMTLQILRRGTISIEKGIALFRQ
jgi:hypothetical protein